MNATTSRDVFASSDTSSALDAHTRRQVYGLIGVCEKQAKNYVSDPVRPEPPSDPATLARLSAQVDPSNALPLIDRLIRIGYAYRAEVLRAAL